MSTNPIAGNQAFTNVVNKATQTPYLSVGRLSASTQVTTSDLVVQPTGKILLPQATTAELAIGGSRKDDPVGTLAYNTTNNKLYVKTTASGAWELITST